MLHRLKCEIQSFKKDVKNKSMFDDEAEIVFRRYALEHNCDVIILVDMPDKINKRSK